MKTLFISAMITSVISGSGCACAPHNGGRNEDVRMNRLGKQLLDLTMKIDSVLGADRAGTAGLADQALVDRATASALALRHEFERYKVITLRGPGTAFSVLVCDKAGAHALLEDVSCTKDLDRARWQESPAPACQPVLQIEKVCPP